MKKATLIFLISFLLTNCGREKYDSLIIGYYCGECYEGCFQGYYIEGNSVYRLSAPFIDRINLTDKILISDETETEKIKSIEKLLPSDLINYPDIIGSPDSHDQCGVYIFATYKNSSKKILIDPDTPEDFLEFVTAIEDLRLL